MPYYRITIRYTDGSSRTCIRQHTAYDIELVNRYYLEQLKKDNKSLFITELEAVMVSKMLLMYAFTSAARSEKESNARQLAEGI